MAIEYKVVNLGESIKQADSLNWQSVQVFGWGGFTALEPEKEVLEEMGNDGWQLCAVDSGTYYFSRPKQKAETSYFAKHDLAVKTACGKSGCDICEANYTDEWFITDILNDEQTTMARVTTCRKTGDTRTEISLDSDTNEGTTDGEE